MELIQETGLGIFPSDWTEKKLEEISGFITKGSTPTTYGFKWENNGVLFLRSECVTNNGLDLTQSMFISEIAHKMLIRSEIVSNDLLITITGNVGRVVLFKEGLGTGNINQHIAKIRINDNSFDRVYVYHFLNQSKLRKYFETIVTGQAYPQISLKQVREARVFFPPTLAEQTAIATTLSDMDALIISLEQLIAKKRSIKQGVMQELLTGKRRLPGFDGEWISTEFGQVMEGFSSGQTPYRAIKDYYKGSIPWITSGELNYNVVRDTNEKITEGAVQKTNLKILPVGTFLMAITGLEAAGTRGSCAITGVEATTNQSCMALFPKADKLTTSYLFHYYVFAGNELALKYCQGTKQQSYTASLAKKLPISLPSSIEEQQAISSVLDDLDTEITTLTQKLTKLQVLKQGMMQNLLTGKIRLI